MKTSEILELVRAGYTKAEIESLETEVKTPEEVKTEQVEQPKETVKTENNETVKTETKEGYKELTELVKNLTETVKAMQTENAKRVSGEAPKSENSESVIRNFFGDIPKK